MSGEKLPMTDADRAYIPPAVRALADKANELMKQQGTPPGNTPVVETPPQPVVATPPTPPQEPAPQPPAPPPAPAEMTDAEIEAFLGQTVEPNSDLARLQHAFRSQIGRTKALQRRLENAAQPVATPVVAPLLAPVADVPELHLPEEVVEQYGADLINLIDQVANHAANKARTQVLKEVAPALQGVASMTVQQLQERAVSAVNQTIAPWGMTFDQLDVDPGFNQWLRLTDLMSGVIRKELFLKAWNSGNAEALSAITRAYLSEVAPQTVTPTPAIPAGATAPAGRTVVPLETFAAPGRAPNPLPLPAAQAPVKETYTRAAVREFFERKRKGEFAGHEQDVAATERLIAEAAREGRIIG